MTLYLNGKRLRSLPSNSKKCNISMRNQDGSVRRYNISKELIKEFLDKVCADPNTWHINIRNDDGTWSLHLPIFTEQYRKDRLDSERNYGINKDLI